MNIIGILKYIIHLMQFRQAKQSFPPHSTLTTFHAVYLFRYLIIIFIYYSHIR